MPRYLALAANNYHLLDVEDIVSWEIINSAKDWNDAENILATRHGSNPFRAWWIEGEIWETDDA